MQLCACGLPLHYSRPFVRDAVQAIVDRLGEETTVTIGTRSWRVPRHYIALHGIKAMELSLLGFEEIK